MAFSMSSSVKKLAFSLLFVSWVLPSHLSAIEENAEEEIYEIVGGEIKSNPEDEYLVREGLFGDVQIGVGGVSLNRETFKFGEYSGIEGDEVIGIGNADLTYYSTSFYLDFFVDNLGLDNRKIFLEAGDLDNFKVFIEHDQIPHLLSSLNKTPFDGVGTESLTLKPGFRRQIGFIMDPIVSRQSKVDRLR
jgi:hypothetical protein